VKLRSLLLAATVAAALGGASAAHATIVERVVAVVGERPVLWTELVHRAVTARLQIRSQTHDANVISVQEQEMYKELLDRMIDDRLEEQQADKAHITVSAEEIDRAIADIAARAGGASGGGRPVTVADVLEEVSRRGMTEQDFRDEMRRQLLEGKLLELRVRSRVRVTESDARSAYQHFATELKEQQPTEVRILALRVSSASSQSQIQNRLAFAQDLTRRARAGEDFCALVREYSDDVSTKGACGSHGAQPIATLMPAIQDAVRSLAPGEVSDPIPIAVGQDEVIVILMPMGQATVPAYDSVKDEMMQRALIEGMNRARKQWLQDLRHGVYVDVRL
jgi:peptidyl-prolyl cis-trans isomerase SurA